MTQSENIKELLAALADAQAELPTMPKSSQAYGYKYTDLDTIVQTIRPILQKHGLAYIQSVGGSDGCFTLTTRLFHKSGQYIEDTATIPAITGAKNNAAQLLGMGITYMRRYALCAMLGITSDEDVNANAPQGNAPQAPAQQKSGKAQTKQGAQPPAPAKPQFQPKGGETTPEEKARIRELLSARYENGSAVFSKDEMNLYSSYRKDRTAAELIAFIENALRNRRSDAPELAVLPDDPGADAAFDGPVF